MPFWVSWFLVGAFVSGTAAYVSQHNPSVAAYNAPTNQIEQPAREHDAN